MQPKRGCCVAIAERDDPFHVRAMRPDSGHSGQYVRAAALESVIGSVAVADAATIETENGMTVRGQVFGEAAHASMRTNPDLVAAGND